MTHTEVSLGFGGLTLPLGSHVASFHYNLSGLRSIVVPFIQKGLEEGDKCICVIHEETRKGLQKALREQGVDVEAALGSGQLSILTAQESYLSPGYFSPDMTVEFYEAALRTATAEGYRLIRITAEMAWALDKTGGVAWLPVYEAKAHKMLTSYPQITICHYNLTKFRGDTIMDALRVHPASIIGGLLIRTQLHIPPDKFLRELERRTD